MLAQPGLFWSIRSGLRSCSAIWSAGRQRVHATLRRAYITAVVAGFSRPNVFAIARVTTGARVLTDPVKSSGSPRACRSSGSGSRPAARGAGLLALRDVGELLALSVAELRVRYGAEAARLHDFLEGRLDAALAAHARPEPLRLVIDVGPPDDDITRLLFGLKSVLHGAAGDLVKPSSTRSPRSSSTLELERGRGDARELRERIESASPTLDVPQSIDLLRLRLATWRCPRASSVIVLVEHARVHARQIATLTRQEAA